MNHEKKKLKRKNFFITIIFTITSVVGIFSLTKIIKWEKDSVETVKQVKDVTNQIEITEIPDNDNTEIINDDNISKADPYWDYVNTNLISVDFEELKIINQDVVGWIQVNGTNINYPFVQTTNNEYYLNHSFSKSYNQAGWIFLDNRNNLLETNQNTILYGHGRVDKIMFGTLKNVFNNTWLKKQNNHIIKLSTSIENTLWQIFSIYNIPSTNDYLQIDFNNQEEFINFANLLINRSVYNFNTSINENDKILTLSTCYNKTRKIVLHAKLIKKESR